jgi:hypothetical protein
MALYELRTYTLRDGRGGETLPGTRFPIEGLSISCGAPSFTPSFWVSAPAMAACRVVEPIVPRIAGLALRFADAR